MDRFISTIMLDFSVAMGIVLGGSMVGAMGAMLMHHPPMKTMFDLAGQLRIWAMVAAVGGSVDALKVIGDGVWGFQFTSVSKQFAYLVASFLGCQMGFYLIRWIVMGRQV